MAKKSLVSWFYLVIKVIMFIALVGFGIALVGGIVAACLPSSFYSGLTNRVKLSGAVIYVDYAVISAGHAKSQVIFSVMRGFVIVGVAFVICYMLNKIFSNAVVGKLFDKGNAKFVLVIGIGIILLGVLPGVMAMLIDIYVLEVAGANAALNLHGITKVSTEAPFINVAFIIFGATALFLSGLFRRGKLLQDEYDATI